MANRDRLSKALWLCEDVPYTVYKEVKWEQISRTGDKKFHERCVSCKYFRLNVQASGRWLETCEATGEQLVWRYGELIKSDNCPFKEEKNV